MTTSNRLPVKPQASSLKPRRFKPRRLKPRSPLRRGIESLVVLATAILLANTFLIGGLLVPSIVSSGSMAPAILGPHRTARCEACGMPLVCDAEGLTSDSLICPNCGWPNNPLDPRTIAGDRLLIDRSTIDVKPPRRWDIAVFHCSGHANDYCVKRIVGLPGEAVEVRDGDVYINGQIARKTLAQQRAMAILVHDSAYRDPHLPVRWQAEKPNSHWRATSETGWACSLEDHRAAPQTDWLTYIHCGRAAGSPNTIEETPIRDDEPYNPDTSRRLNDVTDLMLVAHLRLSGSGALWLRANDGREIFSVEIQPTSGRIALERDGSIVQTAQFAARLLDRPIELVLSTFDQRVLLAIDREPVLTFDYQRSSGPLHPVARPLAIGASELEVAVGRLQVYRDVYYTPPKLAVKTLQRQLGPDEYFALGDNSPISVDSRSWMGGATVPGRLFVGRLLNR